MISPTRQLTDEEKELIWKKPLSHKVSVEELRICKEIKRNWHRGEMKMPMTAFGLWGFGAEVITGMGCL